MSDDGPPTLAPGALLGGKFRIVRVLGTGGMGAVYEIEHEITKHRRALKLLHADVARYPSVVTRFLREASAAGRVGNPHIIETFDAGNLETGEPYVVMEMLTGKTVADAIEHTRLPLADIVDLVSQACEGVQAAHDAGIIHRDLKPENLFVITKDGAPFVKILDFGVSKFDAATTGSMALTAEGSAIGTPFYMPPEQVRGGKDIDARADVYSLGVILYECATGTRPFIAETLPHLSLLIHEGKYTPVHQLRPDLPRAFSDVVARAMCSDRDQRFPTARALAEALRATVSEDPGLGATAFAPSTAVPPTAVPAATPASPTRRSVTAESMALGVTAEPASVVASPGKRGIGPVVVVVASVAALVVAFVVLRTKPPAAPAVDEPRRAASAPPADPTPGVVTPAIGTTVAAPPPSASASAPPAPPKAPTPPVSAPPKTDKPATNTRVDQKGLAKENPF